MAGLLVAEQVAGAADVEVAHRDLEAGAELGVVGEGREAGRGVLGQRLGRGVEQVGEGALARAADPAADLVGLGEAELVGALDDQRVGGGDVEARLDDRRRHQAVGLAAQEVDHRLLQLALVHLPVGFGEARLRGRAPRSRSATSGSDSIRLWRKKAWPPRSSSRSIACCTRSSS